MQDEVKLLIYNWHNRSTMASMKMMKFVERKIKLKPLDIFLSSILHYALIFPYFSNQIFLRPHI